MAEKKSDAAEASAGATVEPVAERRAERAKEYGQWVANEAIYVGNALAYNEGDPVPASNVKRHGYDKSGQVRPAKES